MRALALLPICLIAFACQSSQHPDYVTRKELRDMLALPPSDEPAQQLQKCDLDSLVAGAFSAQDPTTRAASALATADARIAPLLAALSAIDKAFDICANNLANAETTAFKRSYAVTEPGGKPTFRTDFEQGGMQSTGRQLDVGIQGQGLFKIKIHDSIGDGFAYTRNGNFFVNRDGRLVLGMGDGYPLDTSITIPKGVTDVSISNDGRITVVRAGSIAPVAIGQLQLYQFMNPQGLSLLSGSLYLATETSGPALESKPGENGAGQTLQGYLEASNVDPTREQLRIRFLQNWRATIMRAIDSAK